MINPASRRVLEKCGFAYQGSGLVELPARGGLYPADHFRLDRRAWESLKTWGHTGFVREPPPSRLEVGPSWRSPADGERSRTSGSAPS